MSCGGWTALVPFKPAGVRKTRLAAALSPEARDALAERMFFHVIGALERAAMVERIVLLAAERPDGWRHSWVADAGRGLNTELGAVRDAMAAARLLVIHADLPFVSEADIAVLTAQAAGGCAVAPDRHGAGTNALALQDFPDFTFGFGAGSLQAHVAAGRGRALVVVREGLGFDVDTAADYAQAVEAGVLSGVR